MASRGCWKHVDWEFNLSHSAHECLIGISGRRPIGVDVEIVQPVVDAYALAKRHFTPGEFEQWEQVSVAGRDSVFLQGWTRKEACLEGPGRRTRRSHGGYKQVATAARAPSLPELGSSRAEIQLGLSPPRRLGSRCRCPGRRGCLGRLAADLVDARGRGEQLLLDPSAALTAPGATVAITSSIIRTAFQLTRPTRRAQPTLAAGRPGRSASLRRFPRNFRTGASAGS